MQLFFLIIFSSFFAQNITPCCKSLCTNKQVQRQKQLDKSLEIALLAADFDQVLLALAGGARAYTIIASANSYEYFSRFLVGEEKIFKLLLVSLFKHECAEDDKMTTWRVIATNVSNCNYAGWLETMAHIIAFYKIRGQILSAYPAVMSENDKKSILDIIKLGATLGKVQRNQNEGFKYNNAWQLSYDEGCKRYAEREDEFLEVFTAIPNDLRGPHCNVDVPPTFTSKTIYFDRLSIFMTALDETFQQTATGRVPLEVVGIIKDYVLYSYEAHLRLAGCYDLQDELKQLEELAAAREQEKDKKVEQARCVIM